MKLKKLLNTIYICMFVVGLLASCKISYKLNGASIDYTTTKTISFENFPNKASLIYAPLAINFNDELQAKYASQTRLSQVTKGGDLQLSGAITGYSTSQLSVKADAFAADTRLTIRIKVKFVNMVHPTDNFEREFSAYRDFPATKLLTEVQDDLCKEMIEEIVEQIFNATVANW